MDPVTAAMAAKFGGSLLDNLFAKNRQEDAQAFSAQQYATRYQIQTEDMKKAGLNPMLSVSQGAGSSPQSSAATPGSNFTSALDKAQLGVLESQARVNNANAAITENVGMDQAHATLNQTLQQTGLTAAQIGQTNKLVDKMVAEIDKIKGDTNFERQQDILEQTARLLAQQGIYYKQQGFTSAKQREVMEATINQVVADTKLKNLDIKAAEALNNLGRTTKELQPFIQMIIQAITAGRR